MASRILREDCLSLTGVFQRLFSALTGKCCLLPVFFLLSGLKIFVLSRITGLIKEPDDDHLRHPAFGFKNLFLFSSLRTSLFSV